MVEKTKNSTDEKGPTVAPVPERTYALLLVAGDYDIIQHVRHALSSPQLTVHNAFNHREAAYLLEHEKFDLLLVDAVMNDRHSGANSLKTLAAMNDDLPTIAIAPGQELMEEAIGVADAILSTLDYQDILFATTQALNIPLPHKTTAEVLSPVEGDDVLQRQLDEISTLFDLSKSLTEVLDLSEVLNRVVEAARHLTSAEEAMILLPEGEEFYLRAKVGLKLESARNFRVKTQDTLAGQVFSSGKPMLIGESGPQKVKTEYFVKSLLYVPIMLKGKSIGVLGVNNRDKNDPFDVHHQQLLINLASFASIAIENARIHLESLERARELETLVAASKVVNSSLNIDKTLPNICKQLANILDVGYSEIYHWEKKENRLNTLARFYETAWRFGHGPAVNLSMDTGMEQALTSNRPLLIESINKKHSAEAAYLKRVGAVAMLIIPIISGEKVLGAIRAFYTELPEKDTYPPDTLRQVHNLALESLVNLLNRTDSIMSDPVKRLSNRTIDLIGANWCELLLAKQGKNSLVVLARLGNGAWLVPPYPFIPLSKYVDLEQTLEAQQVIAHKVNDANLTPGTKLLFERTESRALLGIPLIQRGSAEGLVIFGDTERDRDFTEREIAMAQAIVGQAATALENANLVRDLEQSLQDLKSAQDRLVQTARLSAMGELAAVVAHQINNPLTTIIVDTELMLADEPSDSLNYKSLTAIARAGKRAANVARRLLAIARPTDANTPPELIDVVDSVRGVFSLVQTHIERGSVRIATDFPQEPIPPVAAIKGRLDDIWLNLMMNAYDALANREGGRLHVAVKYFEDESCIRVTITDNGPGIPDEIKSAIFSPFFTTKPVGEGTGLGLHVCREVVENVGGEISVESEPGKLTRFTVQLPVANI